MSYRWRGHSSAGRALASQAKGRGFESRCPLHFFISNNFPQIIIQKNLSLLTLVTLIRHYLQTWLTC